MDDYQECLEEYQECLEVVRMCIGEGDPDDSFVCCQAEEVQQLNLKQECSAAIAHISESEGDLSFRSIVAEQEPKYDQKSEFSDIVNKDNIALSRNEDNASDEKEGYETCTEDMSLTEDILPFEHVKRNGSVKSLEPGGNNQDNKGAADICVVKTENLQKVDSDITPTNSFLSLSIFPEKISFGTQLEDDVVRSETSTPIADVKIEAGDIIEQLQESESIIENIGCEFDQNLSDHEMLKNYCNGDCINVELMNNDENICKDINLYNEGPDVSSNLKDIPKEKCENIQVDGDSSYQDCMRPFIDLNACTNTNNISQEPLCTDPIKENKNGIYYNKECDKCLSSVREPLPQVIVRCTTCKKQQNKQKSHGENQDHEEYSIEGDEFFLVKCPEENAEEEPKVKNQFAIKIIISFSKLFTGS